MGPTTPQKAASQLSLDLSPSTTSSSPLNCLKRRAKFFVDTPLMSPTLPVWDGSSPFAIPGASGSSCPAASDGSTPPAGSPPATIVESLSDLLAARAVQELTMTSLRGGQPMTPLRGGQPMTPLRGGPPMSPEATATMWGNAAWKRGFE